RPPLEPPQTAMGGFAAVPSTCRPMPCFAVPWPAAHATMRAPRLATGTDPSGERDERTIPWHTAICETARRPPGFVEGNRGIPGPRRDDRPALGEAGGDARSPAPARQDGLGLRVSGGAGRMGAQSESPTGAGEREQCLLARFRGGATELGGVDPPSRPEAHPADGGGGGRAGDRGKSLVSAHGVLLANPDRRRALSAGHG